MKAPVHIELLGLPGVGKTHLMQKALTQHADLQPYILPNDPATWSQRLRDYPFYLRYFRLSRLARRQPFANKMIKRLKRLARRQAYIARHKHRILADCGLVQPALELSMFWQGQPEAIDWRGLLQNMLRKHCYVIITDDLNAIIQRELNRNPRQFSFSGESLRRCYADASERIEQMRPGMYASDCLHLPNYASETERIDALYKCLKTTIDVWLHTPHSENAIERSPCLVSTSKIS